MRLPHIGTQGGGAWQLKGGIEDVQGARDDQAADRAPSSSLVEVGGKQKHVRALGGKGGGGKQAYGGAPGADQLAGRICGRAATRAPK